MKGNDGTASMLGQDAGGRSTNWLGENMVRLTQITLAAVLLLGGTSFVMAQNGPPTGGYPGVAGGANGNPFRSGSDETTSAPTAANPYYGYYDSAVPYGAPYYGSPYYNPSDSYGYVRPRGWR
jgi:hypothetical protein